MEIVQILTLLKNYKFPAKMIIFKINNLCKGLSKS